MPSLPRRSRVVASGLALAAVVVVAYLPALGGPFFFDDEHFIQKNAHVLALDVRAIYGSSVTDGAGIRGNFYRPNQQLAFALLHRLFGATTTWPFHLLPLLLHLVIGALLFAWLRLLRFGAIAAGLAAALFLLHPVQTEAVSYVSGLGDPLALSFVLGAVVVWSRAMRDGLRTGTFVIVPALAILAFTSKENGIVVAPLVLLALAFTCVDERRAPRRAELALAGLVAAMSAGYVALKLTVLRFGDSAGLSGADDAYTTSLALRLKTFVSVIWDYAVLVFFPRELHYEKPYRAYAELLTPRGLFGIGLVALALAVLAVRPARRPRAALGAGVVVAGLAPYTGVVPLNAMFLEHWLYVPMIGIAILVAAALDRVGPPRSALVAAGIVLGLFAARAHARNVEWGDAERFYLNEIAHDGASVRITNNLGMLYAERGELDRAITYYRLAAKDPHARPFPQPHHNLANLHLQRGETAHAAAELRAALRVDPAFTYSLALLHQLLVELGDAPRAALVAQAFESVREGRAYDHAALDRAVFGP